MNFKLSLFSASFILFFNCYVIFMLLVFCFQLGGGYLFGLPVGFIADSIGATIGATAAFILGRTVSH